MITVCEEKLNKEIICIKGKKKKEKIHVKQIKNLKTKNKIVYCYTDFDFEIQTVYLPPIKDRKTKELLIRRKLNILDENLIIHFIQNPEIIQNNQILHYVYILKKKKTIDTKQIKALTLSQIAIHNISNIIDDKIYIYHCFADEEKLILNISKGNILIYSRVVEIPDSEKKDPINFFYENINITYHYILQNKTQKIDLIILSGQMHSSLELAQLTYNFSNTPVSTIFHKSIAENIKEEDFQKYLVPIGAFFTQDVFNFLPESEKEKKVFNTVLNYTNIALASILIISAYLLIVKISNIEQKLTILQNLNTKFIKQQSNILKQININIEELAYYENYIRKFIASNKFHPYSIIHYFKDLFQLIGKTDFSIKKDIENFELVINIKSTKKFSSFSQMETFRTNLERLLEKLSQDYQIENQSQLNFSSLEANINITIHKPI